MGRLSLELRFPLAEFGQAATGTLLHIQLLDKLET